MTSNWQNHDNYQGYGSSPFLGGERDKPLRGGRSERAPEPRLYDREPPRQGSGASPNRVRHGLLIVVVTLLIMFSVIGIVVGVLIGASDEDSSDGRPSQEEVENALAELLQMQTEGLGLSTEELGYPANFDFDEYYSCVAARIVETMSVDGPTIIATADAEATMSEEDAGLLMTSTIHCSNLQL